MRNLRRGLLALIVLLALAVVSVDAKPIRLARHPDYHGGKIVFSYYGDLWVVNDDGSSPRRLTVHTARDTFPRFSPDGKWIAFSSDRYGNDDVFVIPATGGAAKQLTFHSAGDTVVGWSRDSKRVIFASSRGRVYPGIASLYEVSVDGGLEMALPTDWGVWASYSPDGKKLAFNRHPAPWWRKHYRGSYSADLWVTDLDGKTFRRLLDSELPDDEKPNNIWPMYGNGEIFFVSDRSTRAKAGSAKAMESVNNIWKIAAAGGQPAQVTRHSSGSLFYPSISADGKTIVYEENFSIWKLDTASGRTSEVKIEIATDAKENNFTVRTFNGETDSYHLSPSTKRAVISTHGELFTIATDRGDVSRITRSYARDTDPAWSPDGKWIAFTSDQSGRDEIWLADVNGENARKISDSDTEKGDVAWAPDSKSLVYSASDHTLYRFDIEGGQTRVVTSAVASNISNPQFSPDGKWISFNRPEPGFRGHLYIVSADGGEARRVTDDTIFSSTGARWTADGKKLIFLGDFVPGGSGNLGSNDFSLYSVSLAKDEKDPLSRDIDTEEEAVAAEREAGARRPRPSAGPGGSDRDKVEVNIDWDGLSRRVTRLTRLSENVTTAVPAPDSGSYAFVTVGQEEGRNVVTLYTIQADGQQMRQVTQISSGGEGGGPGGGFGGFGGGITSLQYARDGRSIFFRQANGIWSVSVGGGGTGGGAPGGAGGPGGGGAGGRRRVNFTVRVEIDNAEERKQVFHEAWRIMKHRFYDAGMHGADWNKVRAVYEPLLADAADRDDMHEIVRMMIGELNASHTGIGAGGGPGGPGGDSIQTRYPGFEIEPDASGYYKVTHVYQNGPADNDYTKIAVGNFILEVNGQPLRSGENYWKHYNLAPGRKMEFTVNSKPTADGAWSIKVTPVTGGAHGTLQYQKWVEERRALVEKLSNGEIGYLHIRSMNQPSLRQFERDLADNHDKKALIIDQRFNPGGNIDQELLQILGQGQYQYTRQRDSVHNTRPARGFFGPMVVMQNERSTSDAEVFPDGFRTLKMGKTVGVTTYGAVIGTGSYTLMDGSAIRTPGSGLWSVTGQNLENYGVPPDVYVDNTPADFLAGRDAQIEKAVEVLKDDLRRGTAPGNIPKQKQT